MKQVRLLIAFPSMGLCHSKFTMALCNFLSALHTKDLPKPYHLQTVAVSHFKGSILPWLREQIVMQAKTNHFTHLLMVDTDMDFPPGLFHRWVEIDKPVVAANCATKAIPCHPTARQKDAENPAGKVVFTTKQKSEAGLVEEVWRVGTGIMLMKQEAFQQLKHPYFPMTWNTETNGYTGEDWNLCQQLEDLSIPILIDHAVSWHVKHIGDFEWSHEVIAGQMMHNRIREDAGLPPITGTKASNGREITRIV